MIAPAVLAGRRVQRGVASIQIEEGLFLALVGGGAATLYVAVLRDDGTIVEWAANTVTVLGPVAEPYR